MSLSVFKSALSVRLKSVLLATDFSAASEKPLGHALAIARHYGAKFYLAHVVSSLGFTIAGPQSVQLASEAVTRDLQQLEHDLDKNGSLANLDHEFIVRQAIIWDELQQIILQSHIDMLVLGTHGRHGFGKLLLGSVAEQIFRHADCLVLTVGPLSYEDVRVEGNRADRSFLFATDFGEASLRAWPYAVSFANHFGAKLIVLHVIPEAPQPEGPGRYTARDVMLMRDNARMASLRRLEQMFPWDEQLALEPQFLIEFGLPSEKILQVALKVKADIVVMGLHRSLHIDTASHLPWGTAYEVACGAACPVLTVRM